MKFYFILFYFFYLFICCKTENNHNSQDSTKKVLAENVKKDSFFPIKDSIELNSITVFGLKIGDTKMKIIEKLSKPNKVKKYLNELSGSDQVDYLYGQSTFTIDKDSLVQFDIHDKKFVLEGYNIQLGMDTLLVKNKFPISFAKRYSPNEDEVIVDLPIKNSSMHLYILLKNEKISSFQIYIPY